MQDEMKSKNQLIKELSQPHAEGTTLSKNRAEEAFRNSEMRIVDIPNILISKSNLTDHHECIREFIAGENVVCQ